MKMVSTVGDLTEQHHGWLIRVDEPEPLRHRTFLLGKGFKVGVRRWTRDDGSEWVGVCDEDGRGNGFVGTERIYPADTRCELVRPVTAKAKRLAKARTP